MISPFVPQTALGLFGLRAFLEAGPLVCELSNVRSRSLRVRGFIQIGAHLYLYMALYGIIWHYMALYGIIWDYMGL